MRHAFRYPVLCVMVWGVAGVQWASAQTSDPAPGADANKSKAAVPGPKAELTVAESLEKAKKLIDMLEASGDPSSPEFISAAGELGKILSFVRAKDPLNVTAGYILGRMALASNRPREALSLIEAYVNDPAGRNDWYAFKLLGDLYLVSYASHAMSRYQRAAELAPVEPEPRIGIAKANLKLVRAEEAISSARLAIQLDKKQDPTYRVVLAQALLLDKKYEEAASTAREAVALTENLVRENPGDRKLLEDLRSRYELLVRSLSSLSDTYPENPDYLIQMVQVMQDFADLERIISYHNALSLLESRRERFGDDVPVGVLYEQARLNRLVGRDTDALAVLDDLLTKDPTYAPALELREAIQPATVGEPTARRDHTAKQP